MEKGMAKFIWKIINFYSELEDNDAIITYNYEYSS